MVDVVSPEKRSAMMAGIKGKDTKPEILVRKALFREGFRYRIGDKKLPGKPDIVLPKYNAVIFVHGCFWHGHDCHLFKWPKSRPDFWKEKIQGNNQRDAEVISKLSAEGWKVAIIWECALKGKRRLPFEEVMDVVKIWLLKGCDRLVVRGLDRTDLSN